MNDPDGDIPTIVRLPKPGEDRFGAGPVAVGAKGPVAVGMGPVGRAAAPPTPPTPPPGPTPGCVCGAGGGAAPGFGPAGDVGPKAPIPTPIIVDLRLRPAPGRGTPPGRPGFEGDAGGTIAPAEAVAGAVTGGGAAAA